MSDPQRHDVRRFFLWRAREQIGPFPTLIEKWVFYSAQNLCFDHRAREISADSG
jgi:hypothetical protein